MWVPKGSRALSNKDYVNDAFGTWRSDSFLVITNPQGGDILTKETLLQLLDLHNKILAFSFKMEDVDPNW